tara:strand:- start:18077 stop:18637 length:561 start_codon:yes stop_codon:yes gene_type:complete
MIKKSILAVLVIFSLTTCVSPQYQQTDEGRHFEITLGIDQEKNGEASLTFEIALDSGYYFVSPHSEGFHQRLLFSIEDTDSLLLNSELIENPKTKEEYDKESGKVGNFVRVKTTYLQKLIIGSQNDFEVSGLIWLAISPIHQPYEIRFVISNRSGKLMIEKKRISTSGYPTFWDKKRVDIPVNRVN